MEQVSPRSWRKSSRCETHACVEVAFAGDKVHVRNSTRPEVVAVFTREEWRVFCAAISAGEMTGA